MPKEKDRTDAEAMRRAEREIGENIPEGMIGLDTEDVGPLEEADKEEPVGPKAAEDA